MRNQSTEARETIPAPSPRRYNTPGAADRCNLSTSHLNKLRCHGGGPIYLKIGRRVVYEELALEAWLAGHRRTSTSEYEAAFSS
jgi:hypothetical protein